MGEAISCLIAGRRSQVAQDKWIVDEKTMATTITDSEDTSTTDARFQSILQRIIKEGIHSPISHVRQASVMWLLSIVKFTTSHPSLQLVVSDIQAAFIDLLSDSDDITQDVASRGIIIYYISVRSSVTVTLVGIPALLDPPTVLVWVPSIDPCLLFCFSSVKGFASYMGFDN